jgi:hypothetical protein
VFFAVNELSRSGSNRAAKVCRSHNGRRHDQRSLVELKTLKGEGHWFEET